MQATHSRFGETAGHMPAPSCTGWASRVRLMYTSGFPPTAAPPSEKTIALPSRVFSWLALVFGVGFSMLALLTRRWALAWIALAGSAVASVIGMLAVWSRQTAGPGHPGPGIGLIVAWIAVILLTFHWARVVWSRTAVQLAAEEARRRTAADLGMPAYRNIAGRVTAAGTRP